MSNYLRFFLLSIFLLAITGCTAQQAKETAFYISLSGSDDNPGTNEKPFATLERARNAIREIKKAGSLPDGGITVYIRGGIYTISKTFKLTAEDSGTISAPILWRANPNEDVRFFGGKVITGFEPIKDPAVIKRKTKLAMIRFLKLTLKRRELQTSAKYRDVVVSGWKCFLMVNS